MAITYTPTTNFGAKDSLPTNDPDKVIKGSEFTTEFTAIQTAFSLAATAASPTFTGTATLPSVDINGGTIDGASIGASSKSSGAFTSLEVSATSPSLLFTETDVTDKNTKFLNSAGNFFIQEISNDGLTSVNRIKLDHTTGNMTFYDDTSAGTVLFLDAVNNRAGINTINPASTLDVNGTVTADGLTVETAQGDISIANSASSLNFARAGTSYIRATDASGSFRFITGANDFATSRLNLAANGDISFYEDTGTTAKLFWDASAEALGLGTTSPAAPFHADVSGTLPSIAASTVGLFSRSATCDVSLIAGSTNLARINFGDNGSETVGQVAYSNNDNSMRFTTNSGEAMRIDSSGNVGIGTTSPGGKLSVRGTSGLGISDSHLAFGANQDAYITTGASGIVVFREHDGVSTNAERMRIDASRNVSIGTTGTDFESAGRRVLRVEGSTNALMSLSDGTSAFYLHQRGGTNGVDIWNVANSYMRFAVNNGEAMRINTSRYVGIGTSTINEKLVLGSSDSGSNFLQITNSTTTAANDRGFYVGIDANEAARILNRENTDMVFSTNNDEKLRIDSSGNILVGSSAASPAAADATAVRYGVGVQAGSLSSSVALTAGTAADVIDLTDVIDGSQNGAGLWLVSIVRDGGSYGTHFVGIFGANNTTATLYETLMVTNLTITVSGTTIRANPTAATDTFKTNVIPLTIGG